MRKSKALERTVWNGLSREYIIAENEVTGRNDPCADLGEWRGGEHSREWKRECGHSEAGFAFTHHPH